METQRIRLRSYAVGYPAALDQVAFSWTHELRFTNQFPICGVLVVFTLLLLQIMLHKHFCPCVGVS